MNAAKEDNLAKKVFMRSILPQIDQSEGFRIAIVKGSKACKEGAQKYVVEVDRFDNYFDSLVLAEFFERYGVPLDDKTHKIGHSYLNFVTDDPVVNGRNKLATGMLNNFFIKHAHLVENFEADKLDETIYANQIVDPAGSNASITIAHTFYGVFNVVSYITKLWPIEIDKLFRSYMDLMASKNAQG